MQAPSSTSTPRVLCPRGAHLARCVQVVDLGSHSFKPGDTPSRKIYFGFETAILRHTFKPENGPEPFMLQTEFAFYMGKSAKKTKLRAFIEGWFGKAFPTDAAAAAFDFSKLLLKPAIITVAHKPKLDGTQKAIVADIFLPESGVVVPAAVNPPVCYEVQFGEDANFRKLPPFLQKKIMESDELSRPANHAGPTTPEPGDDGPPIIEPDSAVVEEEDIPF